MAIRLDQVGRLDAARRTPQGGLRVDAHLSRTGIFIYKGPDGKDVREYRPAEEVFKADSLDTLKLAPVVVGHPDMVRTDNFTKHTVGVVAENVRQSDKFVRSDVLIQDRKTIDAVEARNLVEVSCGYQVDVDPTPGITPDGEHYDAVQRNIRYNHVGIGPSNWGRAGAEVRLHLDGKGDVVWPHSEDPKNSVGDLPSNGSMTPEEKARLDAAEGARDALKSENDILKAQLADTKSKIADTQAKLDGINSELQKRIDRSEIPALVAARSSLEKSASYVLGSDFKFVKADGKPMSDEEIVTAVVVKNDPGFKVDGKSIDYLRGQFDTIVDRSARSDAAHVQAAAVVTGTAANGAVTKSRLDQAIENANEEAKRLATAGPPIGAMVRK